MEHISEALKQIVDRNSKVESDKAWETSYVRRLMIAGLTYIVVAVFMLVAGISRPWLSSVVPTAGYILSTLTIPVVRRIWLKKHHKRNNEKA